MSEAGTALDARASEGRAGSAARAHQGVDGAPEGEGRTWAVDLLFALSVVATLVYWYHVTARSWFYVDEWQLALRGYSIGDFLKPYNGHLSIVYVAIYRFTYIVFGFQHYAAFRVIGMLAVVAVPVALYVTTRAQLGSALAGVVGVSFLWFHGMTLEPGGMNHPLALAAGICCAYLLPRPGNRKDIWLAVALTAALATAGGGVAAAVGCVIYLAVARPRWQRWAAVLGPCAAWASWWLVWGRAATAVPEVYRVSYRDIPSVIGKGILHSFSGLALGRSLGGAALLVVFVLLVGWQLRSGLRRSATTVAWTAAALAWWLGLILSRGKFATPETFRYQFTAAAFLVYAVVPPLADLVRRKRPPSWAAAPLVATAGLLLVTANITELRHWADMQARWGSVARNVATVAGSRPGVLPENTRLTFALSEITQREYQVMSRHYGAPLSIPRSRVDAEALLKNISVLVGQAGSNNPCPGTRSRFTVPIGQSVSVRTLDTPVHLAFRRFGKEFVPLQVVPAHSGAVVTLQSLGPEPWVLQAVGGCRAK